MDIQNGRQEIVVAEKDFRGLPSGAIQFRLSGSVLRVVLVPENKEVTQ